MENFEVFVQIPMCLVLYTIHKTTLLKGGSMGNFIVYKTFLFCSEVVALHWISGCFFFYLIISIAATSFDHNRKTL